MKNLETLYRKHLMATLTAMEQTTGHLQRAIGRKDTAAVSELEFDYAILNEQLVGLQRQFPHGDVHGRTGQAA